jgi:hypothetical protein
MTRSSEDIEREVESARGDLDRTVEALKDKMTPGQLIDELSRTFKGGGAGDVMSNLGAQVRENPMALAMIGAGMAWLMMPKGDHTAGSARAQAYPTTSPSPTSGSGWASGLDTASEGGGGTIASKVGDTVSGVKEAVSHTTDQAMHGLQDLGGQATAVGRKAARSFEDILQQEPLIVGALGLAVGVAIGAALPATAAEDRTLGAARDNLLQAGEDRVAAAAQGLRASGRAAYDAVKEEADRQGLTGDGGQGSLVEKAESVIRSGVEAARDELGGARPT